MSGPANRNVPVSQNPLQISSAFAGSFTVVNTGTKVIYLGQNSALAPGNGLPVNPNGSLQWAGDSELWAVTVAGETSQASILYSASAVYTPGPSSVDIKGTVPVSIGSTVPVSIGQRVEVVPINNVNQLASFLNLTTFSRTIFDSGVGGLVGYSTIHGSFKGNGAVPGASVTPITVSWLSDAGDILLDEVFLWDAGALATFALSVKGSRVIVRVGDGAAPSWLAANMTVSGNSAVVSEYFKHDYGNNTGAVGVSWFSDNYNLKAKFNGVDFQTTQNPATWYVSHKAGPANFHIYNVAAGTSVELFIYALDRAGHLSELMHVPQVAPLGFLDVSVILPNAPILFRMAGTIGARYRITATFS